MGGPVVEVCAVAKRDLRAGETLDEYGMFMTYGEAVNAEEMSSGGTCPRASSRDAGCAETSPRTRCSPTTTSTCRRAGSPTGSAPSSTATSGTRPGSKTAWRAAAELSLYSARFNQISRQ